jgi:hypothetical protein
VDGALVTVQRFVVTGVALSSVECYRVMRMLGSGRVRHAARIEEDAEAEGFMRWRWEKIRLGRVERDANDEEIAVESRSCVLSSRRVV